MPQARREIQSLFEQIVTEEGQRVLGWRDVPTDNRLIGASAVAVQPVFKQIFIGRGAAALARTGDAAEARAAFERKLYVIRKRLEHAVDALPLHGEIVLLRGEPVVPARSPTRAC